MIGTARITPIIIGSVYAARCVGVEYSVTAVALKSIRISFGSAESQIQIYEGDSLPASPEHKCEASQKSSDPHHALSWKHRNENGKQYEAIVLKSVNHMN